MRMNLNNALKRSSIVTMQKKKKLLYYYHCFNLVRGMQRPCGYKGGTDAPVSKGVSMSGVHGLACLGQPGSAWVWIALCVNSQGYQSPLM